MQLAFRCGRQGLSSKLTRVATAHTACRELGISALSVVLCHAETRKQPTEGLTKPPRPHRLCKRRRPPRRAV
eukprot:3874811-Prymnesium_polylepis.2